MIFTITNILVGITVIVSLLGFQNRDLVTKLLFHPVTIRERKEYFRFLTSGFVHADFMHLAFNMIALYSFGNSIEDAFTQLFGPIGKAYFLIMYLTAIPVASSYDFYDNRNNGRYAALGASGGVAAIIFSSILFEPFGTIQVYFIPIPSIVFGFLYLGYTIYMSKKGNDNIGHFAHLFGSIYGVLFTIAVFPKIVPYFIQQLINFRL